MVCGPALAQKFAHGCRNAVAAEAPPNVCVEQAFFAHSRTGICSGLVDEDVAASRYHLGHAAKKPFHIGRSKAALTLRLSNSLSIRAPVGAE
jgi:hypothetical protein